MEDAHITDPHFDDNFGLFAVFDGHGGIECAKFCGQYFGAKLKQQRDFKYSKNINKALEATFLGLDETLMTSSGNKQI